MGCSTRIICPTTLAFGTFSHGANARHISRLPEVDPRNMSVDIDVVDVIYAPGTGALAFGGITPADLFAAMEILRGGPIGAFDLVEVTPALDPTGVTERMAANAILTFLTPRIYEH